MTKCVTILFCEIFTPNTSISSRRSGSSHVPNSLPFLMSCVIRCLQMSTRWLQCFKLWQSALVDLSRVCSPQKSSTKKIFGSLPLFRLTGLFFSTIKQIRNASTSLTTSIMSSRREKYSRDKSIIPWIMLSWVMNFTHHSNPHSSLAFMTWNPYSLQSKFQSVFRL